MMSAIMATSNPDKFTLYSDLFSSLGLHSNFLSLSDLNITNDEPEQGSILERAVAKAQYCLAKLTPQQLNQYSCIIAVDTGIKLPTKNIETPNAKELVPQILTGQHISAGDPLHTLNGYAIILLPSQQLFTFEVEIPFKYLGNPRGLKVTKGRNILGDVVTQPHLNTPNQLLPQEVDLGYRLPFFQKLTPLINQINQLSQT